MEVGRVMVATRTKKFAGENAIVETKFKILLFDFVFEAEEYTRLLAIDTETVNAGRLGY